MKPKDLRAGAGGDPPHGLSGPLIALWHAARGDWHKAHETVMDDETPEAAWVHAHLHRLEGDDANAAYWYQRAGRPHARNSHDEEWDEIAGVLLAGHGLT